jgi:hypothetical protein
MLLVAPLIVGGALLLLAFWMGRLLERVKKDTASARIDPRLHNDLIDLVRRILAPVDLDHVAYLPEPERTRAQELIRRVGEHEANLRRAERRRTGY